ncbi:hypothetical protein GGX14DRAFT_401866 [Mycena pura]|uniref:Uncharacterized protein n=1 Tax=Mycena pura TaxID=153505 RepID=A0AAD6Y2V6_9AGAR|nr:hypothetical protein GGX14DRAFT_401866 [Mycena pura]
MNFTPSAFCIRRRQRRYLSDLNVPLSRLELPSRSRLKGLDLRRELLRRNPSRPGTACRAASLARHYHLNFPSHRRSSTALSKTGPGCGSTRQAAHPQAAALARARHQTGHGVARINWNDGSPDVQVVGLVNKQPLQQWLKQAGDWDRFMSSAFNDGCHYVNKYKVLAKISSSVNEVRLDVADGSINNIIHAIVAATIILRGHSSVAWLGIEDSSPDHDPVTMASMSGQWWVGASSVALAECRGDALPQRRLVGAGDRQASAIVCAHQASDGLLCVGVVPPHLEMTPLPRRGARRSEFRHMRDGKGARRRTRVRVVAWSFWAGAAVRRATRDRRGAEAHPQAQAAVRMRCCVDAAAALSKRVSPRREGSHMRTYPGVHSRTETFNLSSHYALKCSGIELDGAAGRACQWYVPVRAHPQDGRAELSGSTAFSSQKKATIHFSGAVFQSCGALGSSRTRTWSGHAAVFTFKPLLKLPPPPIHQLQSATFSSMLSLLLVNAPPLSLIIQYPKGQQTRKIVESL